MFAPAAKGFSLIELLIVVSILIIMTVISVPFIYNYRVVYKSEEQSLKIMDLAREASQLALNRRRTYRLEIDLDSNTVNIIDENGGDPDTLVKSIPMEAPGILKMDQGASGIAAPNPPNYPDTVFAVDTLGHQVGADTVIGHNVWMARFRSDGSVVNSGNTPISATLWVYPPVSASSNTTTDPKQVRAVTIFGGSGAVRFWRYNGTVFSAQ